MSTRPQEDTFFIAAAGSPDFCRRVGAISQQAFQAAPRAARNDEGFSTLNFSSGSYADALQLVMSNRPHLFVIEVGPQHSDRTHVVARKMIAAVRERLGQDVFIAAAITASERLFFAGDLLFENNSDLSASNYVDTFLVNPPSGFAQIDGQAKQLENLISLMRGDLARKVAGGKALPHLGHPAWAPAMADTASRELWMRWLPRYASYVNENPLIVGDTGTGKTKLAYAVHVLSGRDGQFVSITPRDFSSSELVQAELFGAVAGAYTGAVDKWGLVKSAERGTLFIDELQSIDKDLQGKLITFIENKIYRRVGSAERVEADVRFVFASNKSLQQMMAEGILRDDFAYRLERVQLQLAPLRERKLDIAAGLSYALAKIRRQRPSAQIVSGVTPAAFRLLFAYDWPGNLRQLENTVAQLCEVADIGGMPLIDESTVTAVLGNKLSLASDGLSGIMARAAEQFSRDFVEQRGSTLRQGLEQLASKVRLSTLEACGGDVNLAADLLGESATLTELALKSAKDG